MRSNQSSNLSMFVALVYTGDAAVPTATSPAEDAGTGERETGLAGATETTATDEANTIHSLWHGW